MSIQFEVRIALEMAAQPGTKIDESFARAMFPLLMIFRLLVLVTTVPVTLVLVALAFGALWFGTFVFVNRLLRFLDACQWNSVHFHFAQSQIGVALSSVESCDPEEATLATTMCAVNLISR